MWEAVGTTWAWAASLDHALYAGNIAGSMFQANLLGVVDVAMVVLTLVTLRAP
jgi:uncharacterized membrane protein